ncbi:glycine cleavage system aminomethyltransferase T [compost metagenome]
MTSGTQTPFLKKAIGLAYLRVECAAEGFEFEIDVRGRRALAKVVPTPFYRRTRRSQDVADDGATLHAKESH